MDDGYASGECVQQETRTTLSLSVCPGRLISVSLSSGDTVQVERGLLWYTIDGRLDDVIVGAGERKTLAEDLRVTMAGLGKTDISLISGRERPRFVRRGGVRPYLRPSLGRRAMRSACRLFGSARQALARRLRPLAVRRAASGTSPLA